MPNGNIVMETTKLMTDRSKKCISCRRNPFRQVQFLFYSAIVSVAACHAPEAAAKEKKWSAPNNVLTCAMPVFSECTITPVMVTVP